ncbi:MAG: radical SAM protein [Methanomicrobiales archaeon]|nr:radical SAM protein [Methanomicrobiales archaeon]MDI6876453.1 radical SAM protein [Methanomicrobiales archaeon]
MLLKKTKTLCPICNSVLDASVEEEGGRVWLIRTCPDHGPFRNLYWADAEMYKRFDRYESLGTGIQNPRPALPGSACPSNCGLCSSHRSSTLLANIDVTNRCNLSCDFCFANARACGYVYEPTFAQIVDMMQLLRSEKPVPPPAVQLSGGEPTMREDLLDIIKKAKEVGFSQVQLATNGIRLANEPDFVGALKESGLSTVYLHFDGITKETDPHYRKHMQAVENCSREHMGVVLVPTVINGKNDHEVGGIIRYAAEHIDVVRGVNFQPVAFTGAASEDDVATERITIPDLLRRIEAQTDGAIRKDDFYPVPCVVPISDLVEAYSGRPQIRFTAHQHCGAATYVFVTGNGLVPINRSVDVDRFFAAISDMADNLKKGGAINKYLTLLEGVKAMHASVKRGDQMDGGTLWKLITKALVLHNFEALRDFHWNALFIGTMHFMDRYNYDLDRVQRCCIHYATPDGRIIPFCSYNSGKVYREEVWKKFSAPLTEREGSGKR